jgi:hypothetical protein
VVNPAALDYPLVLVGDSVTQILTITNPDAITLTVTAAITGTDAAAFALAPGATNGCALAGQALGQDQACTLDVIFTPLAFGVYAATAEIVETTGTTTDTTTVPLTGATVLAQITPAALNFGSVLRNDSVTDTLTITNTGAITMTVTAIITGTDAASFAFAPVATNGCDPAGQDLGPDQACTLDVTFSPLAFGAYVASVEITSTEPFTYTVPLAGSSVAGATVFEGTLGTEVLYTTAASFGDKKGKVLINGVKQKVTSWEPASIQILVNKVPGTPAVYDVEIQPKPKGTAPIVFPDAFTVRAPEVTIIGSTLTGSPKDEVTIAGLWFSNKKPKVFLDAQKCKVKSVTMNPVTGVSTLVFVVHKKVTAGIKDLTVENKVATSAPIDFLVTP